jgi:hypothetical protein
MKVVFLYDDLSYTVLNMKTYKDIEDYVSSEERVWDWYVKEE